MLFSSTGFDGNEEMVSLIRAGEKDALLVVDIQNDFLPGGSLAVPGSNAVIPALNEYIGFFRRRGLPIYACRDWHPENHCSFRENGGPWPPHCIAGTHGAAFSPLLDLPEETPVVSKGTMREREAYSAFEGTDLDTLLKKNGIERIFLGGLTTDYCVLNTIRDATRLGYRCAVLVDATKAVNLKPGDGQRALDEMEELGASMTTREQLR